MPGRIKAGTAKAIGWAASKTGSRYTKAKLLALQARIGRTGLAHSAKGPRPVATVNSLVRRLQIATNSPGFAEKAGFGVAGFGAGLITTGTISLGALIAGLGIAGKFSFDRLEKNSQKKLVASLIGRPRLAEAVCGRMINPRLETQLQCLGKIFLPKQELIKLRKFVLNSKNFDFGRFWVSISPLVSLGKHFEANPRLTRAAVTACLEAYKAKLEYPISKKASSALGLAISCIEMIEHRPMRFRTLKSIIQQVFAAQIPEETKKDAVLHLGRRMLASPTAKIESDLLADLGLTITAQRLPDETARIEIKKTR